MDLMKLNQFKEHYKDLSSEIESLNKLLVSLDSRSTEKLLTVTPFVVADKLRISEMDAMLLLTLAANEKILQTKFKVWSNENTLLGDYNSSAEIPEQIEDPNTGEMIDRDHFYIEIAFEADK